MPLKMFVWRDVLVDYTSGLAVAIAETEEQARQVLVNDAEDYEKEYLASEISKPADEVYESAHGVHVWGGG